MLSPRFVSNPYSVVERANCSRCVPGQWQRRNQRRLMSLQPVSMADCVWQVVSPGRMRLLSDSIRTFVDC